MKLIGSAMTGVSGGSERKRQGHGRELTIILSGIVLTWMLVFLTSCFFAEGNGKVYATDAGLHAEDGYKAGIQGLMNSIVSMKEYFRAGETMEIEAVNEEILVGSSSVRRSSADRNTFCSCLNRASSLGYRALAVVSENQMPYDEYLTLLKIVEAEATGGDIRSKLLVANVVLNRVEDPHFPNTISEVVWQSVDGSAQFSPTADGRIQTVEITEDTMTAVNRALKGEDDSQGALFFIARNSASAGNIEWFDSSLVRLYEYGGHEFYTFREYCE